MNKKGFAFSFFCVFFLSFVSRIHAQELKEEHRFMGIGISSSFLHIGEVNEELIPSNFLTVSYTPLRSLRLEGHYGFYGCKDESEYFNYGKGSVELFALQKKAWLAGGGLFGIYPAGKTELTFGLRFSGGSYQQDHVYQPDSKPGVLTDKGNIRILSLVTGAEYYLYKWLSIGADIGLNHVRNHFYPGDSSRSSGVSNSLIIETGISLQFYPF